MKPVSRLVETVKQQMDEQKILHNDVSGHRETVHDLDKMGMHLKYFSQKQDVVLIKNLLVNIQHRWEKVVAKCGERGRLLEHGLKEAQQFEAAFQELSDWLDEQDTNVEADTSVSSDPDVIKVQLQKHKEFQRLLGAKQPVYDNTMRFGRVLKDKCQPPDSNTMQSHLNTLKAKWIRLCGKSIDRQRQLEEALLFSGHLKDALQELLDWLSRSEPFLSEESLVHGDLDTVNHLIEEHKVFEQQLSKRKDSVGKINKSIADKGDADQYQSELIELKNRWERIETLTADRQVRLDDALKMGESFHKKTHMLLEWLADAEMKIRRTGTPPDGEPMISNILEDHLKFEEQMAEMEPLVGETIELGEDILQKCHPDAIITVKHWNTIIKARWDEVKGLSQQKRERYQEAADSMRETTQLLDELLMWLTGAEASMSALEQSPFPQDLALLEQMMRDHQDFENDMFRRQPDVEKVTKSKKRPPSVTDLSPGRGKKGRPGHKEPPKTPDPVFKDPKVATLFNKWRQVWLMTMDRRRKLADMFEYLHELERLKSFDFEDWRKRYMRWMNHNKARVMDFFRRQDRDHDGKLSRHEFIDGILATRFPTTRLEMERVADAFDANRDGFIDYKEFVAALRPDREPASLKPDHERIQDEVKRQVSKCTCPRQYPINKIGEGKYRFGESQKLRLVRILRSTVMVRVGGGWLALDEFLVKNDPCRTKGRTNIELREQFILAEGVSQSMAAFVSRRPGAPFWLRKDRPGNQGSPLSPDSGDSPRGPTYGPITKIREKTPHERPWRQGRTSHDTSLPSHSLSLAPESTSTPRTRRQNASREKLTSPDSSVGSRERLFRPAQSKDRPISSRQTLATKQRVKRTGSQESQDSKQSDTGSRQNLAKGSSKERLASSRENVFSRLYSTPTRSSKERIAASSKERLDLSREKLSASRERLGPSKLTTSTKRLTASRDRLAASKDRLATSRDSLASAGGRSSVSSSRRASAVDISASPISFPQQPSSSKKPQRITTTTPITTPPKKSSGRTTPSNAAASGSKIPTPTSRSRRGSGSSGSAQKTPERTKTPDLSSSQSKSFDDK